MSEDRSVHTDALKTLGTILDDKQGRDAIHIAVEPVLAGEDLLPGQRIGFLPDGTVGPDSNGPGIADPFLTSPIRAGQRLWLLVLPRTITSLRHVWEHPAFPTVETTLVSKSASERWMRKWAMQHFSYDYDESPVNEDAAYAFAIRAGFEHTVGSHEDARDYIDDQWWDHWEAITGAKGDRDMYFSCSC